MYQPVGVYIHDILPTNIILVPMIRVCTEIIRRDTMMIILYYVITRAWGRPRAANLYYYYIFYRYTRSLQRRGNSVYDIIHTCVHIMLFYILCYAYNTVVNPVATLGFRRRRADFFSPPLPLPLLIENYCFFTVSNIRTYYILYYYVFINCYFIRVYNNII